MVINGRKGEGERGKGVSLDEKCAARHVADVKVHFLTHWE